MTTVNPGAAAFGGTSDASDVACMQATLRRQREAYRADPYPDVLARRAHIAALIAAIKRHRQALVEAVNADFSVRSASETTLIEVLGPVMEARHALAHLSRWMKGKRRRPEWLFFGNKAHVQYQPKGVVGIIGTWNFPVYLTLGPLVAALAAGNRAMIKVSEFTPRTGEVLRQLLGECFDESRVAVFAGGVDAAKAFSALPFDHLIFTGAPGVGKQVMRAAADNLTPVTLELGGKSPAVVGPSADLADAALRITHGKLFNAGQICVAPDYALVPSGTTQAFVRHVRAAAARLYPQAVGHPDYTSIVSERHAARLRDLLADARAKGAQIYTCGSAPGSNRQLALHVITRTRADMQVMREEIFGPILPIVEYDNFEQALDWIRDGERPLAVYGFGLSDSQEEELLLHTHAGGVCLNDWGWHVFQHDLPFGGIGNSGMGTYHGEEGFRELSHAKAVFKRRRWFPVALFYPPYGNIVQRMVMRLYLGK